MTKVHVKQFTKTKVDMEDEEYGMENASFRVILAPFKDIKKVFYSRQEPQIISLVYTRNYLRLLGLLPRIWKGERLYYKILNKFIMAMMILFSVTITCDLYEACQDILQFGEDLVILLGAYLVFLKIVLCAYYARDIESIIREFAKMHKYFSQLKKSPSIKKIHRLQRIFFLAELISFFFYFNLTIVFTAAMCLAPLMTQSGGTPYRAKYPFNFKPFAEYPISFSTIYLFQSIMTIFILQAIITIDNIGCHIFTQTTLNLKIFCIRIRELGSQPGTDKLEELHKAIKFHQYLISLISKINHVFYYNYACQMAASTFMICLSAFEALLAQDQPMEAIKFQIYMFSAFNQLFYWCATGNMVYYNSLDVADAAYEIDHWYEQSKEFSYNLRFLIRRAQKPLAFQPKPLFCFNIDTFVSILSTSYSYFALLRTMND